MPEGPLLYPPEDRTDQASEVHLAELIREQVLRRTREELPHAVEVALVEVAEREDGLIEVSAQIWAETDSQKAILIGKGGRMVREIGTAARKELERELGAKVFLDLQVRVREQLAPRRGPARPARDRLGLCSVLLVLAERLRGRDRERRRARCRRTGSNTAAIIRSQRALERGASAPAIPSDDERRGSERASRRAPISARSGRVGGADRVELGIEGAPAG